MMRRKDFMVYMNSEINGAKAPSPDVVTIQFNGAKAPPPLTSSNSGGETLVPLFLMFSCGAEVLSPDVVGIQLIEKYIKVKES